MNGNGPRPRDIMLLSALAIAGGGGGSALQNTIFDPRPDPFTGSQGDALEIRVASLEASSTKKWDRLDAMFDTLHRIEVNMAKLPPQEWRDRIRALEQRIPSGYLFHDRPEDQ